MTHSNHQWKADSRINGTSSCQNQRCPIPRSKSLKSPETQSPSQLQNRNRRPSGSLPLKHDVNRGFRLPNWMQLRALRGRNAAMTSSLTRMISTDHNRCQSTSCLHRSLQQQLPVDEQRLQFGPSDRSSRDSPRSGTECTVDVESPKCTSSNKYSDRKHEAATNWRPTEILNGDVSEVSCDRKQCVDCCRRFVSFFFTTIGSCCLMVGYVVVGGLIFCSLEADYEQATHSDMRQVRRRHVDWLWNITNRINVLHPENWTREAETVFESLTREVS